MIRIITILFFMVVNSSVYSQSNENIHLYVPLFGSKYDDTITSIRIFNAENMFTDNQIFCSVTRAKVCEIDFKIEGRNWYIKSGSRWLLFYDDVKKRLTNIELKNQNIQVQSDQILVINNDTLYGFLGVRTDSQNASFANIYYFHPDYGIILIRGHDGMVRRLDYHNTGLKREIFYPPSKEESDPPKDKN